MSQPFLIATLPASCVAETSLLEMFPDHENPGFAEDAVVTLDATHVQEVSEVYAETLVGLFSRAKKVTILNADIAVIYDIAEALIDLPEDEEPNLVFYANFDPK